MLTYIRCGIKSRRHPGGAVIPSWVFTKALPAVAAVSPIFFIWIYIAGKYWHYIFTPDVGSSTPSPHDRHSSSEEAKEKHFREEQEFQELLICFDDNLKKIFSMAFDRSPIDLIYNIWKAIFW